MFTTPNTPDDNDNDELFFKEQAYHLALKAISLANNFFFNHSPLCPIQTYKVPFDITQKAQGFNVRAIRSQLRQ